MKRNILTLLLLLGAMTVSAQSRVHYTYDNAGNRLTQQTLFDEQARNQLLGSGLDRRDGSTQSRQVAGSTVSVTTYTGTGQVTVEVLPLDPSDDCQLAVYSLSGHQVANLQVASTQTTLDLSDSPKGIYILLVRLNGGTATWKIIMK